MKNAVRPFPWTPAIVLTALAATVGLPFALRPKDDLLASADETLVIVSPHNEATRSEFTRGFREWHQQRTGKTVRIDWRIPGGASEIARYLQSQYQAPFELYWRRQSGGKPFSSTVKQGFDNPKVTPGPDAMQDNEAEAARRAFLASNVSSGMDLFFGGGSFDFAQQAAAGRLVDSGVIAAHPEWFNDANIPQTLGGEPYYDKQGRWIGVVLSSFGICYNVDAMERIDGASLREGGHEVPHEIYMDTLCPGNWAALTYPNKFGRVALADPNQSGSVAKAFEMIVQASIAWKVNGSEHVYRCGGSNAGPPPTPEVKPATPENLQAGWTDAMQRIMQMGANARYFTDSATKIAVDVAQGDAALGMAIDFYGRFESENARAQSGRERMRFVSPTGGTSYGADPIGLLRGAPHPEAARSFIEYVLSLEGQRLWNFKVGTPGGPKQYALRRLPIRRELYAPEFETFRSDPDVLPYAWSALFTYHPEWTGALFNPIRFIIRVMCVDPHEEARAAWSALIQANFPPEATAAFNDVSAVSYDEAKGRINETLRNPDKLNEARLAAELTGRFRAQYRRAEALARAGK